MGSHQAIAQTLCVASVGLLGLYLLYFRRRRRLPPGPRFTLLGRMYGRNSKEASEIILGLKKKYGDVCCIHVMGVPCIYLNTVEKIRQYFIAHGDALSGRIDMRSYKLRFASARGMIMNDGSSWQENRRFVLSALRDFGFGRGGTEQIIQSELQQLIGYCAAKNGEPFNPRLILNITTCNVMSLLIFGEREGSQPGFSALHELIEQNYDDTNVVHEQFLHFMLRLASRMPSFLLMKLIKHMEVIRDYIEAKVEKHRARYNGEVNDLVDGYLKKIEEDRSNNVGSYFTDIQLYAVLYDLFVAGMETTSSSLRWAILFMARNQQVQKRVQEEIDEYISVRLPNSTDRKDLVYTDATLMEIQRFATLTPLGALHHRCTEDVTIDQFDIPKNSMVYPNIFAVHRDEKIWSDPYNFNPENFYDAQSKSIKNSEYLIPFGVGRRSCLGESLAKQELFVLFVGLLQHFSIIVPSSGVFPSPDDCYFGNLRVAPSYEVVLKPRTAKNTQ